jgi:proline iminopeptidase
MVLRGVFAAQDHELDWLYKEGGASRIFRQQWQQFTSAVAALKTLPPQADIAQHHGQHSDLLRACDEVLQSANSQEVLCMAHAWCAWEDSLSSVHPSPPMLPHQFNLEDDLQCLAMAKISAHMFCHDPDLGSQGQVLPNSPSDFLMNIRGIVVQGQFDMVTPPETAWQLQQVWPQGQLRMVHTAGHSSQDPALQSALVAALDDMLSEH